MNKLLLVCLVSVTAIAPLASAKNIPLEQATITRTINDVRVLDPKKGIAPARVSQLIKDDMGVKTGIKSRAELLFQDNTLTRLGAESYFTFRPGTREMSLDSGTLLLQVPKDHGGATIRSASITASITGTTIMIENIPRKSLKVLVLEGSLRLSMNERIGEALSLKAGKMIILSPGARNLPDPVNVDLRSVIKTSSLINPDLFSGNAKGKPAPLPSMPLIAAVISEQEKLRTAGKLQDTNLVILGKGTTLVAANSQTLNALVGTSVPVNSAAADGAGGQAPTGTAGTASAGSAAPTSAAPTSGATAAGDSSGTSSGGSSAGPFGLAGISTAASTAFQNSSSTASTGTAALLGGNGTALVIGTVANPHSGNVDITSPVLQSSGNILAGSAPTGTGGSVGVVASGAITVSSAIEVSSNSPTRMSTSGGVIRLESFKPTSGTGIDIANSAQLLALLNSAAPGHGGRIEFVSSGSKIQIGGKIQADRGTITVDQNGAGGQINLNNANMAANVIAISAVQPNGVLNIGNSHLTANNLLRLYGGSGSGGVYFTQNTLLDGTGVKLIAGKEVSIANGKVVTLGGGFVTVFTDKASYSFFSGGNGSTTGKFQLQGAPGVTIMPFRLPYSFRP